MRTIVFLQSAVSSLLSDEVMSSRQLPLRSVAALWAARLAFGSVGRGDAAGLVFRDVDDRRGLPIFYVGGQSLLSAGIYGGANIPAIARITQPSWVERPKGRTD